MLTVRGGNPPSHHPNVHDNLKTGAASVGFAQQGQGFVIWMQRSGLPAL